jgi:hypothetical protein
MAKTKSSGCGCQADRQSIDNEIKKRTCASELDVNLDHDLGATIKSVSFKTSIPWGLAGAGGTAIPNFHYPTKGVTDIVPMIDGPTASEFQAHAKEMVIDKVVKSIR